MRLADLGRREEALTAINEAVTIRRALAETRPDAVLPDLADSLNNEALRLASVGRRKRLTAIDEAVTIHRPLAATRPDVFLPDLAMSLNNQSLPDGPGTAGRGADRDQRSRHRLPGPGRSRSARVCQAVCQLT